MFLFLNLQFRRFYLGTNQFLITCKLLYVFVSIGTGHHWLLIRSSVNFNHPVYYLYICELNRFVLLFITFLYDSGLIFQLKIFIFLRSVLIVLNKIIFLIFFIWWIFKWLVERIDRLVIWIDAIVNLKLLLISFWCIRELSKSAANRVDYKRSFWIIYFNAFMYFEVWSIWNVCCVCFSDNL